MDGELLRDLYCRGRIDDKVVEEKIYMTKLLSVIDFEMHIIRHIKLSKYKKIPFLVIILFCVFHQVGCSEAFPMNINKCYSTSNTSIRSDLYHFTKINRIVHYVACHVMNYCIHIQHLYKIRSHLNSFDVVL